MNNIISPVYLRAGLLTGIQYCDQSDIVPEHEYHVDKFMELLETINIEEEIYTTVHTREDLHDISVCYGIDSIFIQDF